jgi:hypothetical protein
LPKIDIVQEAQERLKAAWRVKKSPQPILASQALDAGKLAFICGQQDAAERQRVGGNEEIVAPDRHALPFKF